MSALDPFVVGATWSWRVALHSFLAAVACYAWTRQQHLPPGRAKRWLLAALLVLPLVTAALPGRNQQAFRSDVAWFDSARVLALPVAGELRVAHLAVGIGLVTIVVAVWQEILPVLHRLRRGDASVDVPQELLAAARALAGWERVVVHGVDDAHLVAAAGGTPRRPRLVVSTGLLGALDDDALLAVVRHEHAHATPRRWWAMHALFLVRLVQLFNPVALWLFREYAVETEIACDRAAIAEGDARPLARALLAVYDRTDRKDLAACAVLRRRVDLLLGRDPALLPDEREGSLGTAEVLAAAALLLLLLPWVV